MGLGDPDNEFYYRFEDKVNPYYKASHPTDSIFTDHKAEASSQCDLAPVVIQLHQHEVIRKTPKGVWIFDSNRPGPPWCRHIQHAWKKKFAYPTIDDARESFLKRKKCQIAIITSQLQRQKPLCI